MSEVQYTNHDLTCTQSHEPSLYLHVTVTVMVTSQNVPALPKWPQDKAALAKLKQPPVCLPMTLPPLITARIMHMHIIPVLLLWLYMKFRCTM